MMNTPHSTSPSSVGFTLIELLIVISIVAVLAGVAYPAYKDYVYKSYRSEAKNLLLEVAAAEEEYFLNNKTYTDDLTNLGYGGTTVDTAHGRYTVSVSSAGSTAFSLLATAKGDQANDGECGNYTLTNLGVKGISGSGSVSDCW